jgi:hypothetical protein
MATGSIGIDGLAAPQTYQLHFGFYQNGSLKVKVPLTVDSLGYILAEEVGNALGEIRCIKSETHLQNAAFQTQVDP